VNPVEPRAAVDGWPVQALAVVVVAAAERVRKLAHTARLQLKKVPGRVKFAADYTTNPDKNSVVPSLILFYVLCVWNGWYNTFVAIVPTQVLEEPLSELQYRVFVWVTFIAPQMTLLGMLLRGKWAWTGAWLQLAGNIGVAGVLWTFIAGVIDTQYWGQGNFAGTWVLASAVGAVVFAIRDVRRLLDKGRWVKHG
jgi:hypothetical protein